MGTERAPEPTMEEILASIRRIISDDEASTAQRATSSEYAEQVRVEDADEEAADAQMIADIERALGGSARGAPEPVPIEEDVDDILDLTEPGTGPDDVMMADEPITVLDEVVEEVVLETEIYEEPRKIDFGAAFPPQSEPAEMADSLSEAVESFAASGPTYPEPAYEEPTVTFVEETLIVAEPQESEPEVFAPVASEPVMEAASQPAPSLDDSTTALERAIAALKAGDLAAFAREAQAGSEAPEPVYVPPAPIYAVPEPEPEAPPAAEFEAPSFEPEAPSYEAEPEPVIVMMEEDEPVILAEPEPEQAFEASAPPWSAETPAWSDESAAEAGPEPEPEFELEPEPTPWRSEGMVWRGAPPANEFELNPARVNGGRDHEPDYAVPGSSKTLEDSVKEMLRPMLKQWLDENMARVLTAALREELESSEHQRRDG